MAPRGLGRTGLSVPPIGYGAFKIGRNTGVKYAHGYALPDDAEAERLLNGVLDLGITYIDTAPAYGSSEERIGRFLAHRRREFTLSTKVGERFEHGQSSYEFSAEAVRASVQASLRRLKTDSVDVLFIHAHAQDAGVLAETDAVPAVLELRRLGWARAVGLSAKTVSAARMALEWADVLMVEFHAADCSFEPLLAEARRRGVGIVVKKPLASGRLPAESALRFVLANPAVSSALVSSLSLEHLRENVRAACS